MPTRSFQQVRSQPLQMHHFAADREKIDEDSVRHHVATLHFDGDVGRDVSSSRLCRRCSGCWFGCIRLGLAPTLGLAHTRQRDEQGREDLSPSMPHRLQSITQRVSQTSGPAGGQVARHSAAEGSSARVTEWLGGPEAALRTCGGRQRLGLCSWPNLSFPLTSSRPTRSAVEWSERPRDTRPRPTTDGTRPRMHTKRARWTR